jgi:hypothetical protein
MFMRYFGGGIGHVTLGMDRDGTVDHEMNIDSEVEEEDMAHEHDSDGDHHPSQPQAPAPVVIEDDQEDVGPEAGRDNESESDGDCSDESESDGDCSDESDGDCSDDDRDSEGAYDGLGSEGGEDTDVDDGYASL